MTLVLFHVRCTIIYQSVEYILEYISLNANTFYGPVYIDRSDRSGHIIFGLSVCLSVHLSIMSACHKSLTMSLRCTSFDLSFLNLACILPVIRSTTRQILRSLDQRFRSQGSWLKSQNYICTLKCTLFDVSFSNLCMLPVMSSTSFKR